MSFNKPFEKNPQTCPGLRDFLEPKPSYITCHVCHSELEIWSDEDRTTCLSCGGDGSAPTRALLAWNTVSTLTSAEE